MGLAWLRRYVVLAPLPGALLVILFYGLDPSYGSGFYPAHGWSTFGVIAGWCVLLAGLAAVAPSQISRWLAVLAALSFIAGPANPGAAGTILPALGFSLTALLILIAAATVVVGAYGWKGRVAWSVGLVAVGVAAVSSFGYPSNPYLDSLGTQVLGALLLSPVFIALGSLWTRLDQPSDLTARAGIPATFTRRFLAGFISWIIFAVVETGLSSVVARGTSLLPSSNVAATAIGLANASVYPVSVVLLQILPTALWGQTPGQRVTGVRVVRVENGSRPGWLRAIVRFLMFQSVPFVGFVYLMAMGVQTQFGLGKGVPQRMVWDHASGTVVVAATKASVNEPSPTEKPPPVAASTRDDTWDSYE